MADDPSQQEAELLRLVQERFQSERRKLEELEAVGLRPIERKRANLIRAIAEGGLRRRALDAKARLLMYEFVSFGARAVLSTGAQRGGDFLNNQLRGRWAEKVVLSMNLPNFRIVPFGPSGAAMPGHEDHRRVITTYGEIEKLEGKRPDLLAFDIDAWTALSRESQERVASWPERLLDDMDREVVRRSRFAIEVKSSTWHFARRRERHILLDDDLDAGRLAITVKDEELDKIVGWMDKARKPVLFFQVLFDEIYCMSFSRMVDALRAGQVYAPGDYLRDGKTGAGGKLYHRFFLGDERHRCALVRFPDESIAHVEVLTSGSVIPFVELLPAQAYEERPEVVEMEVQVAERELRVDLPAIWRPGDR